MSKLIEKLEKWVNENPEEADTAVMNITTGRAITTREMLNELKREEETSIAIVDEEVLQVKKHIEDWLTEIS